MTPATTSATLALGIDTGGTYTDAVLVTHPGGQVLAAAKALTTPHDLAVGVGQAIGRVLEPASGPIAPERIAVVGLSTTLATNAIVEGAGHPVCLLLIGYDPVLLRRFDLDRRLVTDDVVFVAGGHDGAGQEVTPLDEAAVRRAVEERRGRVDAFAVSGYFSVRNPAHELRARDLVRQDSAGDPPVTCAHELSGELDSVRRATTAALNAGLVPLLAGLVDTVRRTLSGAGIAAPLMVVKGDGSMVGADFALERPVETILSGPAASVIGAWHLAGRQDAWVADVGGTTTDIAVLRGGLPRLDPEGARVGGHRTLVEAVHVRTVGLGGDSHVRVDERRPGGQDLRIGPRRVVPLSLLASQWDGVSAELRRQRRTGSEPRVAAELVLALRRQVPGLDGRARELLARLGDGPVSLVALAEGSPFGQLAVSGLRDLERRRAVLRCGFTPTDALHVLGRYTEFDGEAAALGAELLARRLGATPADLCERVVEAVSRRLALEVAAKALADEGEAPDWEQDPGARALLERAFAARPPSDLAVRLALRQPLVLVGAPVVAYGPRAAELLHTELVIPPHADVANAVGAVAGGVVRHLRVRVRPTEREGLFHVMLPEGTLAVRTLEEGVALARQRVPPQLCALLHRAGADGVEVRLARDDRTAPIAGGEGRTTLVETELLFTAVGKPRLGVTPPS